MTQPSKKKRIIVFFGSDIKVRGERFLKQKAAAGYGFLALDSSAVSLAASAGLDYSVLEDWLTPAEVIESVELARKAGNNWFRPAEDEFSVHGICWPEMDGLTFDGIWQDLVIAEKLNEKFKANDIKEVAFFRPYRHRPNFRNFWLDQKEYLSTDLRIMPPSSPTFWMEAYRIMWTKIKSLGLSFGQYTRNGVQADRWDSAFSLSKSPPLKSDIQILLACRLNEYHRYRRIIDTMTNHFGPQFAVVFIQDPWSTPVRPQDVPHFPVIGYPEKENPKGNLQGRFIAGLKKAMDASRNEKWFNHLQIIGRAVFRTCCVGRWPSLVHRFSAWLHFFTRHGLKQLVTTSYARADVLLVIEAAIRTETEVFTIPHGAAEAGYGRCHSDQFKSHFSMLYSFLTQRSSYLRAGIESTRLLPCRNLWVKNEYIVRKLIASSSSPDWKVLGLLDPTGNIGHINKFVSLRAQLDALKMLGNPPQRISDHWSLKLKGHPYFQDFELVEAAGHSLSECYLPSDTDLNSALEWADLVIAINYFGSALIHSIMGGLPVISLITDRVELLNIRKENYNLFLEGTSVVRDRDHLWNSIWDFFTDKESAQKMRLKSKQFAQTHFDDSNYPSISEVMQEHI